MASKSIDITIQLPPSAWSQMGINAGEHTASPPHSPMSFEQSRKEKELQRKLEKAFGKKFGPNDPTPSTPKDEGKKQNGYDSPIARPTPRTTPNVSPQKAAPAKKPATPMAPIDENGSTINFDNLQQGSPVVRRQRVAPTPHHTPVTPEERVERVALGKFKPRALFQEKSINKA